MRSRYSYVYSSIREWSCSYFHKSQGILVWTLKSRDKPYSDRSRILGRFYITLTMARLEQFLTSRKESSTE